MLKTLQTVCTRKLTVGTKNSDVKAQIDVEFRLVIAPKRNKEITKPRNGLKAFILWKRDIVFPGCGEHRAQVYTTFILFLPFVRETRFSDPNLDLYGMGHAGPLHTPIM
jgi:hypothetical protein